MIPADSDIAFPVEACAESAVHVVRNKTTARTHVRTVSEFAAVFFVPENDIGKAKNLVVKEIYCTYERADVEHEHQRTLNAKICNDCWKRKTRKRRTDTTNIELFQKPLIGAELNLTVVNDFFGRRFYFSGIQNNP